MGKVSVRRSPLHGRGVFADTGMRAGEVVCVSPAIPLGAAEFDAVSDAAALLHEYLFCLPDGDGAAVFGEVSMMNHSDSPNAALLRTSSSFIAVALQGIAAGEEITHRYLAADFDRRVA